MSDATIATRIERARNAANYVKVVANNRSITILAETLVEILDLLDELQPRVVQQTSHYVDTDQNERY